MTAAQAERPSLNDFRQRLTVAVLTAFVVAVLAFAVASGLMARDLQTAPCGVPLKDSHGRVYVYQCEHDDAPRGDALW